MTDDNNLDDHITARLGGTRKIVELASLIPSNYNPHDITKKDVDVVAKSVEEFGYLELIIVNKRTGNIIGGHTRVQSLVQKGYERGEILEVDVGETEEKRLNLLLNHQASYDMDALEELVISLNDEGADIYGLGLDTDDIDRWLGRTSIGEVDETDDDWSDMTFGDPETEPGKVYYLGKHRLICGDATDPKVYEKLFQGDKAQIAFYSPPYNIGALHVKGDEGTSNKYLDMDDTMPDAEYYKLLDDSLQLGLHHCDEVLVNIMLAAGNKVPVLAFMEHNTKLLKDVLYWVKTSSAPHIQPGVVNNRVEFIVGFGNGKRSFLHAQFGQGTFPNVIEGPNNSQNEFSKIHKAVFPLYLPIRIIQNFCDDEAIVLDSFGGTGTTLIAADRTGRICYMIEKNPLYCDVIRKRYERETQGKAEKEVYDE